MINLGKLKWWKTDQMKYVSGRKADKKEIWMN